MSRNSGHRLGLQQDRSFAQGKDAQASRVPGLAICFDKPIDLDQWLRAKAIAKRGGSAFVPRKCR